MIDVRVAVTEWAVQLSEPTRPYVAEPVESAVVVAQLIVTLDVTRSVR